jgi:FlaA1/EpsC-like NDP-sugar epimerase
VTAPANAIDWHAFLARPPLPAPRESTLAQLTQASILVTGAGGSIGSALSLRLAKLRPRQLLLLDASEQALYRLQIVLAEAGAHPDAQPILGNVNDPSLLHEILAPRQLIFHAAAHKHVPLLERHPLEAIANNALATLTLANAAANAGAARIVLLSTDKAAAPASILGATKHIAESIVLAHHGIALRLANVLGTEGSVSETFTRQIAARAPITITTPEAERYFLNCDEAVDLLLTAATAAPDGSLLAPQLPHQHRITELARFLGKALSPEKELPIVFTGHRPGDKTSEVFWSAPESTTQSGIDGLLQISHSTRNCPPHLLETLRAAVVARDLPLLLDAVTRLVPGYSPSESIHEFIRAQLRPVEVSQ